MTNIECKFFSGLFKREESSVVEQPTGTRRGAYFQASLSKGYFLDSVASLELDDSSSELYGLAGYGLDSAESLEGDDSGSELYRYRLAGYGLDSAESLEGDDL